MNIRPQFLVCIFGITLLSGCELAVLPLLPLAPLMKSIDGRGIIQPVNVVSETGELLASPSDPSAEAVATFTVQRSTRRCSTDIPKSPREQIFNVRIPIKCDDGLYGDIVLNHGDYANVGRFF
jgi:hypothetical protein